MLKTSELGLQKLALLCGIYVYVQKSSLGSQKQYSHSSEPLYTRAKLKYGQYTDVGYDAFSSGICLLSYLWDVWLCYQCFSVQCIYSLQECSLGITKPACCICRACMTKLYQAQVILSPTYLQNRTCDTGEKNSSSTCFSTFHQDSQNRHPYSCNMNRGTERPEQLMAHRVIQNAGYSAQLYQEEDKQRAIALLAPPGLNPSVPKISPHFSDCHRYAARSKYTDLVLAVGRVE